MRIILILLLTFSIDCAKSQSIPSYWMNVYGTKLYVIKHGIPKHITVNSKHYYASGDYYTKKSIYNYISNNELEGVEYKNEEEQLRFKYTLDSLNRILTENSEEKYPLVGWTSKQIRYNYVDAHLTQEMVYKNNTLIRNVYYKYNEKGNIESITIYNDSNERVSQEEATYDYDKDIYHYKVYNGKGDVVLSKLNYCITDTSENIRNAYGDFTKLLWTPSSTRKKTYLITEYKYDSNNNWIEKKDYSQSDDKTKIQSIITRKIKYRK